MGVTIKDIAKAAGVSPSTVSRTINDHYSISEETKQRIRKVMDELGYDLGINKPMIKNVGVVFPKEDGDTYENPFYLEAIRGIGMVCNQRGYRMIIITGNDDYELRNSIKNSNADGYIFLYSNIDDQLINYMYNNHLLFVLIGKAANYVNETLCVDTDNIHAAYEAVNYLVYMGHKKIGYVGTDEKKIFSLDRKMGYIQAMNEHNLEIKETYIQSLSDKSTYAHKLIINQLKDENRPTAFVTCDDIHAMILERLIRDAGLKVPEDIEVVSVIGTKYSIVSRPTISSCELDFYDVGSIAMRMVTKLLKDELKNRYYHFDARYNSRSSTRK